MSRSFIFLIGLILGVASGAGGAFGLASWLQKSARQKLPSHFENAQLARLPFDGTWQIAQGGEEESQNAHHGLLAQNLAMDIVRVDSRGRHTYEGGDRGKNEGFLSWAQPIYSPTDGTVEIATDGIPDNIPGEVNGQMVYGNSVQIRCPGGYVVVLAHFKNGSVVSKRGDKVRAGDLVGLCGNSGHTREPHLHFQVQSEGGYEKGVALRPVFHALVLNGKHAQDYSPVKSDIVANSN